MRELISPSLTVIYHHDYLEVIFTGRRTYEEIANMLEIGVVKCQNATVRKILTDTSRAKGNWQEFDRFRIGEKIALHYPPPYKIAVIEKKEIINKFVENTAYNRGVDILITDDRKSSMDWLFKEKNNHTLLPDEMQQQLAHLLHEDRRSKNCVRKR